LKECISFESLRGVKKDTMWLWYPFLPTGKISILVAEQGEGKTTMALAIASYVTRGIGLPGMDNYQEPGNVIFQSAEDDYNEVIFQRLEAAGADMNRISFINDPDGLLTLDSEEFPEYIDKKSAKLLILDPIQAYIGTHDLNRATDIRNILSPLRKVAAKTGCAILLIAYYNKARRGSKLNHVMGSIDITNLSRNVISISHLSANPESRFMTLLKSTFVKKDTSIMFQIVDQSIVFGEITSTPIEDIQIQAESSQHEKACDVLTDILANGPVWSKDVEDACIQVKIGLRTVAKAKRELGVESIRNNGKWYWLLPKE
jgi:RecA-family ATPase